jgi:hypothetical protein
MARPIVASSETAPCRTDSVVRPPRRPPIGFGWHGQSARSTAGSDPWPYARFQCPRREVAGIEQAELNQDGGPGPNKCAAHGLETARTILGIDSGKAKCWNYQSCCFNVKPSQGTYNERRDTKENRRAACGRHRERDRGVGAYWRATRRGCKCWRRARITPRSRRERA